MTIEPIAYFKSQFKTKFGVPRQSSLAENLIGEIHFTKKYRRAEALKGLEGFDWLWLIWEFSQNRRRGLKGEEPEWSPTVRPPRLGGNATVGVFASRSPFRPNPLGLSSVRITGIDLDCADAPVIRVSGADLCDGTPIYDIKPYLPYTDAHVDARGAYTDDTEWESLRVEYAPEALEALRTVFSENDVSALTRALELDPRPRCREAGDKPYGLAFGSADIRFRVCAGLLTVFEVKIS